MTSGKVPLAVITKILKRSEMWGDLAGEWVGSKLGSRLLSHSARGTALESKTPAVHAQLLPCLKNKLFVSGLIEYAKTIVGQNRSGLRRNNYNF